MRKIKNNTKLYHILNSDSKRAYVFALAKRPICIEIPHENHEENDEKKINKLNVRLCGTRGAALHWQCEFIDLLVNNGFEKRKSSPCNFDRKQKELLGTIHGNDFVIAGFDATLGWFQNVLNSKCECKHKLRGPGERIVYAIDQRHGQTIIKQLKLEETKPRTILGNRGGQKKIADDDSELMTKTNANAYGMVAARLNRLAMENRICNLQPKTLPHTRQTPKYTICQI